MKVFAIRDEQDQNKKNLAYLLYYENEKRFYIELPEDADLWDTPLLLSSLLKKGERTINSYWSQMWVRQRIVPSDRQNLGQILRENGLKKYDEFSLLMLANGRCAQDDYYLCPITEEEIQLRFRERYGKRVEDVVALQGQNLLVFFRDGSVKKVNTREIVEANGRFVTVLQREEVFRKVKIQTGGYGICWGENFEISDTQLYKHGKAIPLSIEDFQNFVAERVINTAEVMEILECSRQNVNDLVKRKKLTPVKKNQKNTLFLKSEVIQRKWI